MGDAQGYRINISAPNLVNVCIDDNGSGDLSGRMYCCYSKEAIIFSGIIELLRDMEKLFDAISFPQASTQTRLFLQNRENDAGRLEKPEKVIGQEEIIKNTGLKGTFVTSVRFRQNATWQGEVFWVEQESLHRFNDSMEFIRIIDRAVSGIKK